MSELKGLIQTPSTFKILPSSKKKVNIKSFNSKQLKNLKIALEGGDKKSIASTLKTVIGDCVEGVNVNKINKVDLEFILLSLMVMSVGSKVTVEYSCNHFVGDANNPEDLAPVGNTGLVKGSCGGRLVIDYDLESADFNITETEEEKDFKLKDGNTILTFTRNNLGSVFDNFADEYTGSESNDLEILAENLKSIQVGDMFFDASNFSTEEKIENVIGILGVYDLNEISNFILSPDEGAVIKAETTCPKCKTKHNLIQKGIENFLD